MNELQIKVDGEITKESSVGLSPYDPSYPISLLSEGLNLGIVEAENTAKEIYNKVVSWAPAGAQLKQIKKTAHYVVDMSEETMKAIEEGTIKLSTNKKGEIFAQLMNENHFGDKLPIKKEDLVTGLNPATMAMAMQMKAMQDQLAALTEQIGQIDRNVKDVLQGQQNDRIAQYYTGAALYAEATCLGDNDMRRALIAQAMQALSDASFKLRLNMKADIQYLASKEYKDAKKQRTRLIDERMNRINQEFAYIHQAALLKAAIYCNEKEYAAMSEVLDEYSHFIKINVASNAEMLAQCDVSDNSATKGAWATRAQWKLDTSELREKLASKEKTLYISCEGE